VSMPNVPDVKPDIELTREQVVHLLLASIAMEELGLAHIINAEGEKLQYVLAKPCVSTCTLLKVNESVDHLLRTLIHKELLLQMKLELVSKLVPCHVCEDKCEESGECKGCDGCDECEECDGCEGCDECKECEE